MKRYTVYKITSPSGKSYIGWTGRPLKKRLQDHQSETNRGFNRPIHKALRKYPLNEWTQEILLDTSDYNISIETEKQLIEDLDLTNRSKGYNLSTGGEHGATGVTRSEENKAKIREGKRNSNWKSTPEHGAKISAALKGHPPSNKQKEATRKAKAKHYKVQFPDGSVHEVYNLLAFAEERGLRESNLRTSSSKGYRLFRGQ